MAYGNTQIYICIWHVELMSQINKQKCYFYHIFQKQGLGNWSLSYKKVSYIRPTTIPWFSFHLVLSYKYIQFLSRTQLKTHYQTWFDLYRSEHIPRVGFEMHHKDKEPKRIIKWLCTTILNLILTFLYSLSPFSQTTGKYLLSRT